MRDLEGFRWFMSARYPDLVRTAYLLVHDWGQAEDLVQTALVKTHRAWPRLRDPANADAYTRTVITRTAIRWSRRRWRGERPAAVLPESLGRDESAMVDLQDAVRRALASLPIEQRAVLVLRYYAQLNEAEIAEALHCSPGTVKSRASRALAALRTNGLLDKEEFAGE